MNPSLMIVPVLAAGAASRSGGSFDSLSRSETMIILGFIVLVSLCVFYDIWSSR